MSKKLTEAEFLALPQNKKAVLLARDVIAQLKARCLTPRSGAGYFKPIGRFGDVAETVADLVIAAPNLCTIAEHCSVCAKGALFVSSIVRKKEDLTAQEVRETSGSEMCDAMVNDDIFDHRTLDLIEHAFEALYDEPETVTTDEDGNPNDFSLAWNFGTRFRTDRDRLTAIMLNVIRNDGRFDPTDRVTRQDVRDALRVTKK